MRFFHQTNIDVIRMRTVPYGISIAIILLGAWAIVVKKPNMSIEFTGGTLLQVKFNELPPIAKVREVI